LDAHLLNISYQCAILKVAVQPWRYDDGHFKQQVGCAICVLAYSVGSCKVLVRGPSDLPLYPGRDYTQHHQR